MKLSPRYILCVRHPSQVARSLFDRDRLPVELGEYRWMLYNAECLRHIEKKVCVIEYESWFGNPSENLNTLNELLHDLPVSCESFTAQSIQDIIKHDLRHTSRDHSTARNATIGGFYDLLTTLDRHDGAQKHVRSIVNQFFAFQKLYPFESMLEKAHDQLVQQAKDTESFHQAGQERDSLKGLHAATLAERDNSYRERDALNERHVAALSERDDALRARDQAIAERDGSFRERDALNERHAAALSECDDALRARDQAITERDGSFRERDALNERHAAILSERDDALRARDQAIAERDGSYRERDALNERHAAALSERDDALRARDRASTERNAICRERDGLKGLQTIAVSERNDALRLRDESIAEQKLTLIAMETLKTQTNADRASIITMTDALRVSEERYAAAVHWFHDYNTSIMTSLGWRITRPLRTLKIGRPKRPSMPDIMS